MGDQVKKDSSMKFLKELDPLMSFTIGVVGGMAYVFTNFASVAYVDKTNEKTVKYVDQRFAEAIEHSDMNRERMMAILGEIKDSVKTVEARTWEEKKGHK